MIARRTILEEARQIVLSDGPSNCLEFTTEILAKYGCSVDGPLAKEVRKQAVRCWLRAHPGWHSPDAVALGIGTVPEGVSRTVGVLIRRGLAERTVVRGRVLYRVR